MDRTAPLLAGCLPTRRGSARARRVSALEELEGFFSGLVCLTDASERQILRRKRKDMEKSHYSGKAGRHAAKVQYTMGAHGLIAHQARHSPGCVHDVRVY